MDRLVEMYEEAEGRPALADDPEFQEMVRPFLPEGYPPEQCGQLFLLLKARLLTGPVDLQEAVFAYVFFQLLEEEGLTPSEQEYLEECSLFF